MKLEIGYNHLFEIRKEEVFDSKLKENFTVLYLSDLHLNKFGKNIVSRIIETIDELNPTLILLGGDYVDSKEGLFYFNSFLSSISFRQNIFAIAGNHDYYFGIDKIKKTIINNNIVWIEKKSFYLNLEQVVIRIDGNFINTDITNHDFSILCLHKPMNIDVFKNDYNIAFAGHLHGCQLVFWESENKLFPGQFFYKWNILKTKNNNCQYFVSKGLGDTLPVRYNCKKDIVFVQVNGNN